MSMQKKSQSRMLFIECCGIVIATFHFGCEDIMQLSPAEKHLGVQFSYTQLSYLGDRFENKPYLL